MAIERTYNIPLRREWIRVPKHRRAKRAVKAVRNFLTQHMKSDEIKIGKYLNELLWSRGMRSPPHHAQVTVTKDDEGIVRVELTDVPKEEKKERTQKKEDIQKAPEVQPAKDAKPAKAEKPAEKKEIRQEKPKAEKKVETKKAEKKEVAPKKK